jgi:hypothetical protein
VKKQLRRGNEPDPGVPAYIINERDWNYFESFAMRGGWREAARRIGAAWRDHPLGLILVNILWACSLFSIIGVPPVTVMMYLAARRALNREEISYDMVLYSLRRYAREAWVWAIPLYGIGLGMYTVLWAVQTQGIPPVFGWLAQAIFAGWVAFNLYYWGLWWHTIPEQRGAVENWRKVLAYWRQYPLMAGAGVAISAVIGLLTVLSGWGFVFLLLLVAPITMVLVGTAVIGAYPPRE